MTDKNIMKAFIIGAVPNGILYKRRVFDVVDAMKSVGALMKIIQTLGFIFKITFERGLIDIYKARIYR